MPEAKKIRAVLLQLEAPLYVFSDNDNGPEWFKDPTRNIMILRSLNTPTKVRTRPADLEFPSDRTIWCLDDLYRFMRSPLTNKGERHPPLDEAEILFVTDRDGSFVNPDPWIGHKSRIPILRVGYRSAVAIDRIIGEIYRIEQERERTRNER